MARRIISPLSSAVLASFLWGAFPLYWKCLKAISSSELLAHRIVWSIVFLGAILGLRGREAIADLFMRSGSGLLMNVLGSVCIGSNWLLYIWAINNGHVLDASLGFYLNPLLSMGIGIVCFGERLSRLRVIALGLAAASVGISVYGAGDLPAISLALAVTFCAYSVLQRYRRSDPVQALAGETLILLLPALAYLTLLSIDGSSHSVALDPGRKFLLLLSGVVTTVPLLLFKHGAQHLSLTTMGFLQYISPSVQLVLGVAVFGESLEPIRLASFMLIWAALSLYSLELFRGVGATQRANAR